MEWMNLKRTPLSVRLFVSLLLCVLGLSYLSLLGSIWIDTEMKISNIIEGYGSFEYMELIDHSFKYLLWFVGIFTITVSLFLFTSYSEKVKRVFAVAVPLFIISDIASMWLICYVGDIFAWQLYGSGLALAILFLLMFACIQFDIWIKKSKEGRMNTAKSHIRQTLDAFDPSSLVLEPTAADQRGERDLAEAQKTKL